MLFQTQAVLPKPQAPHKPIFSDGKGSPSHRREIFRRWWENVICADTFDCISAEPSLRIDGRLSNHGSFPSCPALFRASYLPSGSSPSFDKKQDTTFPPHTLIFFIFRETNEAFCLLLRGSKAKAVRPRAITAPRHLSPDDKTLVSQALLLMLLCRTAHAEMRRNQKNQ